LGASDFVVADVFFCYVHAVTGEEGAARWNVHHDRSRNWALDVMDGLRTDVDFGGGEFSEWRIYKQRFEDIHAGQDREVSKDEII
jgi:hypothetical protein